MEAVREIGGHDAGEPQKSGDCHVGAKWAAVVDDILVPLPQRIVLARVIKTQAGIPEGFVLVRDHNSPDDVLLKDEHRVDLSEGNVFYRLSEAEVLPRGHCCDVAKRAFIVDDRPEITIRPDQTGKSIRDLFNIPAGARLIRDMESPIDEDIEPAAPVNFIDGPVFYTRQVRAELSITVNARVFTEHDGVTHTMTGLQIAALVYRDNPSETRVWLVSPHSREVQLSETVHIRGGEVFDVVRKEVKGGYELSRIELELNQLRAGGLNVTFVTSPVAAVVYHDLRTRPGHSVASADVLVPVPGAYPGQMIDWAYLPEGSPLIGRVKGSAQAHRVKALDRVWQQISYHPHNGGGAPAWNPTVHGFHTYLGELASWLYNAQ